jgi:hypothetical protein
MAPVALVVEVENVAAASNLNNHSYNVHKIHNGSIKNYAKEEA